MKWSYENEAKFEHTKVSGQNIYSVTNAKHYLAPKPEKGCKIIQISFGSMGRFLQVRKDINIFIKNEQGKRVFNPEMKKEILRLTNK